MCCSTLFPDPIKCKLKQEKYKLEEAVIHYHFQQRMALRFHYKTLCRLIEKKNVWKKQQLMTKQGHRHLVDNIWL